MLPPCLSFLPVTITTDWYEHWGNPHLLSFYIDTNKPDYEWKLQQGWRMKNHELKNKGSKKKKGWVRKQISTVNILWSIQYSSTFGELPVSNGVMARSDRIKQPFISKMLFPESPFVSEGGKSLIYPSNPSHQLRSKTVKLCFSMACESCKVNGVRKAL